MKKKKKKQEKVIKTKQKNKIILLKVVKLFATHIFLGFSFFF